MSKIFGHESILHGLASAAAENRLSHAYIFEGATGIGKTMTVHWLSQIMMCQNGTGCGNCDGCFKIAAGSHPDVIHADFFEVDKGKPGSIEVMRKLRQDAYAKPFLGQKKLYVIPHADEMLAPAQNSLLKILEEPPEYCVFVLLCENANKLLETVRSRSVILRFLPLDETEMMAFLLSHYDDKTARLLLRPSGGIPGRALRIAQDDDYLLRWAEAANLFCQFFSTGDLLPLSSFLEKERDLWEERLEGLADLTAEAAQVLCGKQGASEQAIKLATLVEIKGLLAVFDLLQAAMKNLRGNANYSLTVTELLMQAYCCGRKGEKNDRGNRGSLQRRWEDLLF